MSTVTSTTTTTAPNTAVLHLGNPQRSFRLICADAIQQLAEILGRHSNEMDTLSVQIRAWGRKVIVEDTQIIFNSDEEMKQFGTNKIIELSTQILTDSTSGLPLKEPVLLTNSKRTCEKSVVDAGNRGRNLTYRTHQFAVDVLRWIDTLIVSDRSNALIIAATQVNAVTSLPVVIYTTTIANFEIASKLAKVADDAEEVLLNAEQAARVAREEAEECLREARRVATETTENIRQMNEEISEAHAATTTVMSARVDDLASDLNQVRLENRQNRDTIASQAGEITSLRNQNYSMQHQLANMPKGGKKCSIM